MRRDLEQLEQRWGLALHSAGFGVWDLDVPAHRVHYSPQWKAQLGYPDADEPESTAVWRERVHPDDLPPMLEALGRHLRGEAAAYQHEFRLRTADGRWRWVLSRGRVVARDAQGLALRAVGTLTDLTDRREAERLRAERDRAEAASRAKSEFLARMSHELRTPLNAVLGFAQLLGPRIGGPDIAQQRAWAAHIEQAGWHLLQMIDDVLDLAQLENGRLPLALQAVDLAPAVQGALQALAPLAAGRGVVLEAPALPPQARVRADPERLAQVLRNLVGNAVQFNRPQGRVSLHAEPVPGPAGAGPAAWALRIVDTGAGIPQAQQAHLFEPFNRQGRVGAGADGVGIGLALSRSLLALMGGTLALRQTGPEGSTFELVLPAA